MQEKALRPRSKVEIFVFQGEILKYLREFVWSQVLCHDTFQLCLARITGVLKVEVMADSDSNIR